MFVVKIKRFTRICIYKQGIFNCTLEQYFFDYRMIHLKKKSVLALLSINGLWDCILWQGHCVSIVYTVCIQTDGCMKFKARESWDLFTTNGRWDCWSACGWYFITRKAMSVKCLYRMWDSNFQTHFTTSLSPRIHQHSFSLGLPLGGGRGGGTEIKGTVS